MHALNIESRQPLLIDAWNYPRFAGTYYLTGLVTKLDQSGHPVWVLTLSDATGDLRVFCNNDELMTQKLMPNSMVFVEAALNQSRGTAYFKCKGLSPVRNSENFSERLTSLPRSSCFQPTAFDALLVLIARVENKALRQFISRILLSEDIGIRYLQCPASFKHHHSYKSGLVVHSVETAWDIRGVKAFSQLENDVAVVAALLHDIGKIRTLTPDCTLTDIGMLVDHQQLTLEVCADHLKVLDKQAPHIANQLRHAWTCYSPNARFGFVPKTSVARYLQKCDRRSASRCGDDKSIPIFTDTLEAIRLLARN